MTEARKQAAESGDIEVDLLMQAEGLIATMRLITGGDRSFGDADGALLHNLGSAARHLALASRTLPLPTELEPTDVAPIDDQITTARPAEESTPANTIPQTDKAAPVATPLSPAETPERPLAKPATPRPPQLVSPNSSAPVRPPTPPARPFRHQPRVLIDPKTGLRIPSFDEEMHLVARKLFLGGPSSAARQSTAVNVLKVTPQQRFAMNALWPTLSAPARHMLIMHACFHLTYEQIARITNNSPELVRLYLTPAKKELETVMFDPGLEQERHRIMQNTVSSPEALQALAELKTMNSIGNLREVASQPVAVVAWQKEGFEQTPAKLHDPDIRITHLVFGKAIIAVNGIPEGTTKQPFKCAVLASLGLSNKSIADELCITEGTVQGHMRTFFTTFNLHARAQLVPHFLGAKAYTILRKGDSIIGTKIELEVAEWIKQGLGNALIAKQMYRSEATVKSHVRSLLRKNEFSNREQLALAMLVSR